MINKNIFKKTLSAAAIVAGLSAIQTVEAANWLMLQGTEPTDAAGRAKVWGFIQAQYQKDESEAATIGANTGAYVPPKLIGPNLSSQEQFNVNRARLGVRGIGMPIDSSVNYFLLAEFGNNAITAPGDGDAQISDASITLNTDATRVRMGLFKTPGMEEGLQAIHVFDYINFTTVGNQLMLERLPNTTYTANIAPAALPNPAGINGFDRPVAAYRDVGIQFFDSFQSNGWDHSYAVMLGNGNGLNFGDIDDNKDTYLYWSSELMYGGKGPRAEGLKFFVWSQSGKRLLDNTPCAVPTACVASDNNPAEFDRTRQGLGVKYLKMPHRVTFEAVSGEGMIFVGPHATTFDMNPAAAPGNGENGKASGYYLDYGFYVPDSKWQFDLRYDYYNRLTDDQFETEWVGTTIGFNYHVNKKSRITVNYEMHDVTAVNYSTTGTAPQQGPNANLNGIGNRIAAQFTHIF